MSKVPTDTVAPSSAHNVTGSASTSTQLAVPRLKLTNGNVLSETHAFGANLTLGAVEGATERLGLWDIDMFGVLLISLVGVPEGISV